MIVGEQWINICIKEKSKQTLVHNTEEYEA